MNKKIELEILDISDTQAQAGAYVVLLGEKNGARKLPIIIGASEAQATAIYLKGVKTQRPLTHDLFHSCLNALETSLLRVLIYEVREGVFYSYLFLKQNDKIIRIDARTSDAIALAIRAKAPILIYESILEDERIHIYDSMDDSTNTTKDSNSDITISTHELEKALTEAIQEENYEMAAMLRDELNKRK